MKRENRPAISHGLGLFLSLFFFRASKAQKEWDRPEGAWAGGSLSVLPPSMASVELLAKCSGTVSATQTQAGFALTGLQGERANLAPVLDDVISGTQIRILSQKLRAGQVTAWAFFSDRAWGTVRGGKIGTAIPRLCCRRTRMLNGKKESENSFGGRPVYLELNMLFAFS